ncbi:MAG: ROK family protein [Fusobacteriaceae bacterium]
MRLGAIEAGGTKFICAVGSHLGEIYERVSFPTTTPVETMALVVDFFKDKQIEALGVGSFGPIDPDRNSPTYGYITKTPKKGWSDYGIIQELEKYFSIPMEFDTDVNGAALGESLWGAAKGLDSCIYLTVGTGIGGGALVSGKLLHGLSHPEMGHIPVPRVEGDNFKGNCPFHGPCLEGMASGPAIEKRWGIKSYELPMDHPAWELEAKYLASGLMTFVLTLSPKKIIMGGGVMKQKQIFPLIRKNLLEMLNGYVPKEDILSEIENFVVPPGLGDNAGICGALALGRMALEREKKKINKV